MPRFTPVFRDKNHLEIVKKTTEDGYRVIDLAGVGKSVPDILVADPVTDPCVIALIEIKTPEGKFSLKQLEFLALWPGICGFADTFEDVKKIMSDPNARLSHLEKAMILEIVAVAREKEAAKKAVYPQMTVKAFEKRFREMGGRI